MSGKGKAGAPAKQTKSPESGQSLSRKMAGDRPGKKGSGMPMGKKK